jgi:hypothetical protein
MRRNYAATVVCSSDGAAAPAALSLFLKNGLAHDNQRTIHSSNA